MMLFAIALTAFAIPRNAPALNADLTPSSFWETFINTPIPAMIIRTVAVPAAILSSLRVASFAMTYPIAAMAIATATNINMLLAFTDFSLEKFMKMPSANKMMSVARRPCSRFFCPSFPS